jgi:predicted metalloprotease with PDZ domain
VAQLRTRVDHGGFCLAALRNDCKELTSQLELLLHRLHALSRQSHALAAAGPTEDAAGVDPARPSMHVAAPLAVPAASTRPFASIDELAADSPASAAGLCMGDELIAFGHVTGQASWQ